MHFNEPDKKALLNKKKDAYYNHEYDCVAYSYGGRFTLAY